jgi:hypothetical protein
MGKLKGEGYFWQAGEQRGEGDGEEEIDGEELVRFSCSLLFVSFSSNTIVRDELVIVQGHHGFPFSMFL